MLPRTKRATSATGSVIRSLLPQLATRRQYTSSQCSPPSHVNARPQRPRLVALVGRKGVPVNRGREVRFEARAAIVRN